DTCVGPRNAVPRIVTKLRETPVRGRDPDHRDVQHAAPHHLVESRKDHLVSEIARRAEEHKRVGRGQTFIAIAHDYPPAMPVALRARVLHAVLPSGAPPPRPITNCRRLRYTMTVRRAPREYNCLDRPWGAQVATFE